MGSFIKLFNILINTIFIYSYSLIRRDTTMARLLMAIVAVFFFCHSTKIIVNFYEAFQVGVWFICGVVQFGATTPRPVFTIYFQFVTHGQLPSPPLWVLILVRINHLLLAINSAVNIVIYSFKVFFIQSFHGIRYIQLIIIIILGFQIPHGVIFCI